MAKEFRLSDIGEGLTEVEIIRWLVSVGDRVTVDQALVEVETAKSIVELPSPYAGTVLHLGAPDGSVLAVGDLVAAIGDHGERWAPRPLPAGAVDAAPADGAAGATPEPLVAAPPVPIVGSLEEDALDLTPVHRSGVTTARQGQALPPVRKLARDLNIDLRTVRGTGPHGRITREDVQAALNSPRADTAPRPGDVRRPLSATRRTIATNLTRAWSQIPMVSAFDDIDASRLLSARRALAEHYGKPVPFDALLVAAVLPVLRALPQFNSTLGKDALVLRAQHDIGLAVDTPEGLMVAVIVDASARTLPELAAEVVRLQHGARTRTLSPEELSGQTFTVSNIGAVGGGHGTPLVPAGTTAIVSVGRATARPVVHDGRIDIAPVMPVSLSYDHRVIDGAAGRRFLAMLAEMLAEPVRLLA